MTAFHLPPDYDRIRVVGSFAELLATPLEGNCNAICWQRELAGDFAEVVASLAVEDAVTTIDHERLRKLPVGPAGRIAIATLIADQQLLRAAGHDPVLECIRDYPRDHDGPLPTDVYSFHVDSATVPTDTFLCSYTAPASEGLRNDQARRHIEDPATRARLLAAFGGADDSSFAAWLHEHHFDLHFAPWSSAQPFSFGVGNLWRLAVAHPESRVPACIHRAPATRPGQLPRLLLLS